MRTTPLSSWTAGQIEDDLRERLGVYTDEDLLSELVINEINRGVTELYGFNGWADSDEYQDNISIPILKRVTAHTIPGSSYDDDTLQLKLPAYETIIWQANEDIITLESDKGFNSKWVGGSGTITDTNTEIDYPVKITGVLDSENISLESTNGATIPDIAAADLAVNLNTNTSKQTANVDLTMLPGYKRINTLIKVTYTIPVKKSTGTVKETRLALGPPNVTTKSIEGMKLSRNYANQVLWVREGENLFFILGKNLSSFGDRVLHFVLFPIPIVTEDDFLDMKDDNIPQLLDYLTVKLINSVKDQSKIKMPLPQSLVDWFNRLITRKNETEKEKSKK